MLELWAMMVAFTAFIVNVITILAIIYGMMLIGKATKK